MDEDRNFADYLQQLVESTGPDTEYENIEVEVEAWQVRKGDQLVNVAHRTAHRIKTGTKWTEIRDIEDDKIIRVPKDASVLVSRQVETEESALAAHNFWAERKIAKRFTTDPRDEFLNVVAKFNDHIAADYQLDYQRYEMIMVAQEECTLERRLRQALQYQYETEGKNLNEAYNEFVNHLKTQLTEGYAYSFGISRSSNQLSNLVDDVRLCVTVDFIRNAKWY